MSEKPKKYNIIYADPPWKFRNNKSGSLNGLADHHYDTMTAEDIQNLPIADLAADDCVLIMWWVGSQPQEAIDLVEAWGFKLKTMTGFNWVKMTKKWLFFFGMGFWTRAGSECCLIAVKGRAKPASRGVRSVIQERATKHSEKPAIFRDRIVELCGDLPRIELFARKKAEGWDSWGNEIHSDIKFDEVTTKNEGRMSDESVTQWEKCFDDGDKSSLSWLFANEYFCLVKK